MTIDLVQSGARALILAALASVFTVGGACSNSGSGHKTDAAAPTDGSNPEAPKGGASGNADASRMETGSTAAGQPCTTGGQCMTGFCADGVCCKTACTGACSTCAAAGNVGTCIPADVGTNPRGMCTKADPTTCGTDGTCDGTGSCEMYGNGVSCQPAGCTGSSLMFAGHCNGAGTCNVMPSQSCAPFTCNTTGQCKTTCMTDADCVAPNTCTNGSCGKKPIGASCSIDTDCNSGICAQGACCSAACTGNCKSCNLTGSAGACTSVAAGQDPLGQCADSGATTCGTDGFCDGMGGCRVYASGTACGPDSCTGGTETLGGRCDGKGTCGVGGLQACAPYVCGATDCKTSCATSADCAGGYVCNGTICGKKVNGVTCATAAECGSGYCEQGVCCNTGCEATCQACNLAGTVGTCTPVPSGQDPLGQCTDAGAASCKNDGTCDGTGKCRNYPSGTVCAAQTCAGSALTAASRCDGAGSCVAATAQSCAPYQCGSASSCLTSCGVSTDCVSPNVCTGTSCGKSPLGATCAAGTDCSSGFCAQGVCCGAACAGTCQSCALAGSVGTCTNVPAGQDPLAQCADVGAATCGNNGFCNGAGACQKYAAGSLCAGATCAGSTYTPPALCNGTGVCAPATSSSCGAYACDAANEVCKTSCTSNTDCTAPNVCNAGACTLSPLGSTCANAGQCASGFCAQGVCCASACAGGCQSCALAASPGTCANVPAGQDPLSACTDGGAPTCGNDGTCDGAGKCRLYASGSVCAAATCAGSTFTPARTCDGVGNCKTVTSSLCTPYACNPTTNACKTSCAAASDCTAPNTCSTMTMSCGLSTTGAACTTNAQCLSGFCAQGVCCNAACTAVCNSCNVAGSVGTCVDVPAGAADPSARCTDSGPATCGADGFCDGNGACQKYASGTQCVAPTCTTSTYQPPSTCTGTGTCATPATASCTPYLCGTHACKATCATNADCISAAYTCSGGVCIQAVNITIKTKHASSTSDLSDVYFDLQITNNGATAFPLSQITIRYWYTWDTTGAPNETSSCTYALGIPGACGSITSSFTALSPTKTNADHYYQLGFTTAAGNLAPGATGEIGTGFHKNDFSNFTQTNDYSYNASTSFTTVTTVTAYLTGALVYGTEPM